MAITFHTHNHQFDIMRLLDSMATDPHSAPLTEYEVIGHRSTLNSCTIELHLMRSKIVSIGTYGSPT